MTRTDLTDPQKKMIAARYRHMSSRQLARTLGLSRQVVEDYIKRLKAGALSPDDAGMLHLQQHNIFGRAKKTLLAFVFAGILLGAAGVRSYTFKLPHFQGDQHHYIGLAMKLERFGIDGYNLRGIDWYATEEHPNLGYLGPTGDKGTLLTTLANANITYYDQPFHHIPFGFPLALMLSHTVFAHGQPYYFFDVPDMEDILNAAPPGVGLRAYPRQPLLMKRQFYAVIVPFVFSLLLVAGVYVFALRMYQSQAIALAAMFLMAISPIDLLTAQRVWADDMTAALGLVAMICYFGALQRKQGWLAFFGGFLCGISVITKQNGAFVMFALIVWHVIMQGKGLVTKAGLMKTLFDRYLILFGVGVLMSAGYWFYKITSVYGTPVYMPHQQDIGNVATISWYKLVGSRPWYLYSVGIPYQNPLFALAYLSPLFLIRKVREQRQTLFFVLWVVVFFSIFQGYLGKGGKEHRYMLPAYPAFAILGAYVADRARIFLDTKIGRRVGTVLFVLALVVSASWSLPMGLGAVWYDQPLIMRPF